MKTTKPKDWQEKIIDKILFDVYGEDSTDPDWTDRPKIVAKLKRTLDQATQEAVEAERKQSYKEGYSDATSIVLEPNHTYRRGVRDGVKTERARLESLIPEKEIMCENDLLRNYAIGFNICRSIMQEAVKNK